MPEPVLARARPGAPPPPAATGLTAAAARALSVVGHPALLVPVAVAGAAWARQAPAAVLLVAVLASAAVAALVGVCSVAQVRAGRWGHVDASAPRERAQLNLFLVPLLLGAALLLVLAGQPLFIAAGLAAGAAVVVVALGLRRWLKLSLHAAFAVFAAALWWPHLVAVGASLLLAGGVAWSRLVLRRHHWHEVLLGLLVGAAAGAVLRWAAG